MVSKFVSVRIGLRNLIFDVFTIRFAQWNAPETAPCLLKFVKCVAKNVHLLHTEFEDYFI